MHSCSWTVLWFPGREISWCFRDSCCALFYGTLVELRNINCAQAIRTSHRFQFVKHGCENRGKLLKFNPRRVLSFVRVSRCRFITRLFIFTMKPSIFFVFCLLGCYTHINRAHVPVDSDATFIVKYDHLCWNFKYHKTTSKYLVQIFCLILFFKLKICVRN